MNPDHLVTALWASAGWVAAAVAAHFAVFSLFRVERRARTLVCVWGLALVGYLGTGLVLEVDRWRIAYGGVVLFCAFILYMPFYYTVSNSLSIQMLIKMRAAPDGLSVEGLRQDFPMEELLAGRLVTLAASGYVVRTGERFVITAKARVLARSFLFIKALWRLGPGG
ncbi:MAG TPA: hypothetical protein VJA45_08935 [Methylomirabilota bacterium]|nr:hypothetical protein [Methylomirabilota bacterium]